MCTRWTTRTLTTCSWLTTRCVVPWTVPDDMKPGVSVFATRPDRVLSRLVASLPVCLEPEPDKRELRVRPVGEKGQNQRPWCPTTSASVPMKVKRVNGSGGSSKFVGELCTVSVWVSHPGEVRVFFAQRRAGEFDVRRRYGL